MRKILIGLFLLAAVLVAAGEQWTMTISASTRGIPVRDPVSLGKTVTAWTNGITTTAGTYYTNTSGKAFMAVTAGTSTNAPSGNFVDDSSDAVTWLNCGTFRAPNGVTACVNSGDEVHYNRLTATTNCPWTVKKIFQPSETTEWFFIPNSGTSTISFITE